MSRKKKKNCIRVYRNSDAQKFVEIAKLRKRQEQEIERMQKSFDRDITEFEYALSNELSKP